jgi:hypothetical protein
VTKRKVLLQFGAQALFIPVFTIFPTKAVLNVALFCACTGIIVSLLMGFFLLLRHRKYIRDNYSYTEHVDVNWAINFAVVLAATFVGFVIVAANVTWTGRTIFYLCMMLSWIYLNKLARRHSVVNIPPLVMFAFPLISNKENEEIKIEESAICSDVYAALAEQLKKCMEEDRLYLNPKLTLQDVCSAIGTNRAGRHQGQGVGPPSVAGLRFAFGRDGQPTVKDFDGFAPHLSCSRASGERTDGGE